MQSDKNFFLSRPSKDSVLGNEAVIRNGVTFTVKYIGCIEVFASMKVLDFQTRSLVAKECIHRVCDAINARTPKKRQVAVDKKVNGIISALPCLEHGAGSTVQLNISSRCLEIKSLDSNEIIARHDMPRISFASGGDADALDYVAYIAKDVTDWRACYVLECGNEMAQSLISTMGQAFELRYKEYYGGEIDKTKSIPETFKKKDFKENTEQDYYNDMPGKAPPESANTKLTKSPRNEKPRERISSNLIDLETTIEHDYINEAKLDEFDDKIFSEPSSTNIYSTSPHSKLLSEKWFHGSISRTLSESLLKNDGDFLVRASQNTRGQFVLTGMKNGQSKHLLLIDPDGVCRTKDRVFDNIPHLINYHYINCMPIYASISSESALLLQNPVLRIAEMRK